MAMHLRSNPGSTCITARECVNAVPTKRPLDSLPRTTIVDDATPDSLPPGLRGSGGISTFWPQGREDTHKLRLPATSNIPWQEAIHAIGEDVIIIGALDARPGWFH